MKLWLFYWPLDVADDDLTLPYLLSLLFHVLLAPWIPAYLWACLVVLCILDVMIALISLTGTIACPGVRRKWTLLLFHLHVLFTWVNIGLSIHHLTGQSSYSVIINLSASLIYQLFIILLCLSALLISNPLVCEFILTLCCLRTNELHGTSFSKISKVLSLLLSSPLYSTSDMFIGMLILRQKCPHFFQESIEKPGMEDLNDIRYYFQYAEAIYGFPLFIFSDFNSGWTHFVKYHLCCCLSHSDVELDELYRIQTHMPTACSCCACFSNKSVIEPSRTDSPILFFSTDNSVFKLPYLVFLDKTRQVLVIAIRGTMSATDVLVDLNCDPVKLPMNDQRDSIIYTHEGMLQSAKTIFHELDSRNILGSVFSIESQKDYQIVCCGHSLGSGVATLLAHLLRENGYKEKTRCIAYSPPAVITSASGLDHFASFCTSVVIGDDFIPRTNIRSLMELKMTIHHVLKECNVSKIMAILRFIRSQPILSHGQLFDVEMGSTERDSLTATMKMYIPGRIIHFRKIQGKYVSSFTTPDAFQSISIASDMAFEHLPNVVSMVLHNN